MDRDLSSLTKDEQGTLAAGVVVLILSLLPWYIRVTFDGPGDPSSTTAWTSFATIGLVLLLGAATIVVTLALDGTLPKVIPWRLVSVILAVLGTILIIFRALTAGSDNAGANVGPGWSGWLLFVAAIVLTVYIVRVFRASELKIDRKADPPPT
jgi:hypothetical protein